MDREELEDAIANVEAHIMDARLRMSMRGFDRNDRERMELAIADSVARRDELVARLSEVA